MATVGLLHPGEMGAAVGGCLVSAGHEVLWDPAGRSRASTGRALAAELSGASLAAIRARSTVIFSMFTKPSTQKNVAPWRIGFCCFKSSLRLMSWPRPDASTTQRQRARGRIAAIESCVPRAKTYIASASLPA